MTLSRPLGVPLRYAGMARLKVFRTPAGFHDAYVAAPSRRAALAAWGSDADLFARGIAEEVTDPALREAPLAQPGAVIRVARTDADAPPETASARKPKAPPHKPAAKRPSRDKLDAAEAALAEAETRHVAEKAALKRAAEELAKRRRALDKAQTDERVGLDRARIKARDAYDAAIERWRAGGR